jgi:two-component system NtrC family sensor kinase
MQNGDLTPEQTNEITDELKMIADETSRCGTIVKNLLLFSSRKVGEFKENDLRSIIAQSMKLIDHHLTMNNVQLQTAIAEDLPSLRCDAEQILQALLALEINAVEAMPQGGTLRIESAVSGNETVTVRIIDSGIGIRADDLPHIFEPFFTTKKEGKGTGLGLAVVYGIIERHGGTITCESAHNAGTTFTITVPQQFETGT